ncbi:MAG: cytochrome c oxidase accessory protein CcoG [Saprospiraceae bacterium]|nr:cytochrome c oxidase accessory protein CcoG [Saprospiraceae bacterium]
METTTPQPQDSEIYRDKLATIDDKGKRVWIYPKKPKGRYYNWRMILSGLLLAFLFGMPFLKVNGEPFLLFNVLERKFILFGVLFMPQDFHLFVLAMLTFIVFIILFTVIFGRIFCGWACPQTIFMEMVFRKIEYWIEGDANAQRRLNESPWTTQKAVKKISKQVIFFAIAVLVANTFLAYLIGIDKVIQIATEPVSKHAGGFVAMLLFSGAFYFVFSYMREQVCIAICPYGRLQGVLLDKNSIVIAYDYIRGEPRGKITRENSAASAKASDTSLGDCIDCSLCVQVCPTGIDIRNGTQLECVNCTACIDACDEVMDKIERPRGLIRYDSANGIETKRNKIFTARVIAYSAVLTVLLGVNVWLLSNRSDAEAVILRTPGMLYQETKEGHITNLYNYQVFNKTTKDMPIRFQLVGIDGNIRPVGDIPVAAPGKMIEGAFFVDLKPQDLTDRKTKLTIEVYSGNMMVDKTKTNFLGPIK